MNRSIIPKSDGTSRKIIALLEEHTELTLFQIRSMLFVDYHTLRTRIGWLKHHKIIEEIDNKVRLLP